MTSILPSRKHGIKEKDTENAKKCDELLEQELAIKIDISKQITQRRKVVQRLHVLARQTRIQRRILADVCQDMSSAGYDTGRLAQILPVLEKIDVLLTQEIAKL